MWKLMVAVTLTALTAAPLLAEPGGQDAGRRTSEGDSVATAPARVFDTQAELQGLYDEISNATLQFVSASDVDLFHDVFYTPDWVFVDAAGHQQTWSQAREQAIQSLSALPDSMIQAIQKLSVGTGEATVVVNQTILRTIVDQDGRYGRPGASHTVSETTVFRDRWVRVSNEWKLKSREQMGQPTVSVDKAEFDT